MFDTVASPIARGIRIPYGSFSVVSFAIYVLVGFLFTRATAPALVSVTVVGPCVGICDARIGWAISSAIVGNPKGLTVGAVIGAIVVVTISAMLLAVEVVNVFEVIVA